MHPQLMNFAENRLKRYVKFNWKHSTLVLSLLKRHADFKSKGDVYVTIVTPHSAVWTAEAYLSVSKEEPVFAISKNSDEILSF